MEDITILLPTYNRKNYLPHAIECVIAQTFKKWRLIVINDGGADVLDIIKKFYDSRIEYINIKHKGKAAALNIGLNKVRSKYISYMDDDDEIFPQHLEKLYKAATINNCDFVYSDTYLTILNENNDVECKYIENEDDVNYESIKFFNKINHKQILHSKCLSDKVGYYDKRLTILIDYDYIKRLANVCEPYHVKSVTGNHILRKKNSLASSFASISGNWIYDKINSGKSILYIFEKTPDQFVDFYLNYNSLYFENTSLNKTLKNQKIEFNILNTKLNADTEEINHLSNLLTHNQEELSNKIKELNNIYSSFSWKVVQKLRYVKKIIIKFFKFKKISHKVGL